MNTRTLSRGGSINCSYRPNLGFKYKWTDSLLIHKFKDVFTKTSWISSAFEPKQMIISQSHIETLKHFQSLKGLCIDKSNFTRDICELVNLEMLTLNNIFGHERFKIPDEMQTLRKLRYLNLARNELENLPDWISELSLKSLIINNNRLKELPSNLPSTLITLDFSVNYVKSLPLSFSRLEKLKYINWESNPIQFPPKAILSNGMRSTMNYLDKFLTNTVPNETIKLLFVGRKRSGKTTLMHALKSSNGKASDLRNITKTNGVHIEEKNMEDVKFKMFDLAGDDNYLETHAMFLSEKALYLAVFNVQLHGLVLKKHDVLTRIEMWLSLIYSRAKNARVIIVATHVDTSIASNDFLEEVWSKIHSMLIKSKKKHQSDFSKDKLENCFLCHNGDLTRNKVGKVVINTDTNWKPLTEDQDEEARSFPHVVGYFEVSSVKQIPWKPFSFQNRSIVQLKEHIVKIGRDMLSIDPSIPKRWVIAKEILERLNTENKITSYSTVLQKVKAVCMEEDEMKLFLQHYTSKGDFIYFDKPNKNETFIVLDPQWLSKQLSRVINYEEVIPNGIISHDHLNQVFGTENVKTILHLFRDTSTFIPFNENNDLIPFLLSIGKPDKNEWPLAHKKNQVDFVFQFSFLPADFFSHIIAAIHRDYSKFWLENTTLVFYYNNIIFVTTKFQEKCCFHENLFFTEQGKLAHRVRFELRPHYDEIVLSIMGEYPCCMAVNLLLLVTKQHETLCPNVEMMKMQLCVECVEKRVPKPAVFYIATEAKDLEKEASHSGPISCRFSHVIKSCRDLRMGKLESRDVPSRSENKENQFCNDKECPKLFLILPINARSLGWKDFFVTSFIHEGYAVQLICECPGAWHFLSAPGYFLKKPKPFVKKYGPRMQVLLQLISTGTGVAKSLLPGPVGNVIGILDKSAKLLNKWLGEIKDDAKFAERFEYTNSLEHLKRADELDKKELQSFLNTVDSKGRFGDLIATLVGDEVLWLCENHARYWQKEPKSKLQDQLKNNRYHIIHRI